MNIDKKVFHEVGVDVSADLSLDWKAYKEASVIIRLSPGTEFVKALFPELSRNIFERTLVLEKSINVIQSNCVALLPRQSPETVLTIQNDEHFGVWVRIKLSGEKDALTTYIRPNGTYSASIRRVNQSNKFVGLRAWPWEYKQSPPRISISVIPVVYRMVRSASATFWTRHFPHVECLAVPLRQPYFQNLLGNTSPPGELKKQDQVEWASEVQFKHPNVFATPSFLREYVPIGDPLGVVISLMNRPREGSSSFLKEWACVRE